MGGYKLYGGIVGATISRPFAFGQMGRCRSTVRTPNFKPTEQALPATKQALPAIPPSLRATSLYTREAFKIITCYLIYTREAFMRLLFTVTP